MSLQALSHSCKHTSHCPLAVTLKFLAAASDLVPLLFCPYKEYAEKQRFIAVECLRDLAAHGSRFCF